MLTLTLTGRCKRREDEEIMRYFEDVDNSCVAS